MSSITETANTLTGLTLHEDAVAVDESAYDLTTAAREVVELSEDGSEQLETIAGHLVEAATKVAQAGYHLYAGHALLRQYQTTLGVGGEGTARAALTPITPSDPAIAEATTPQAEPLDPETFLDEFDRFAHGEVVRSYVDVIGAAALTMEEEALLRAVSRPYADYSYGQIMRMPPVPIGEEGEDDFNIYELQALRRVVTDFVRQVRDDCLRSGNPEPLLNTLYVYVGDFRTDTDSLEWHTDGFGFPMIRYIATVGGANATEFAEGTLDERDLYYNDVRAKVPIGAGKQLQPIQLGPGVITRFAANHGVHRTPTQAGFRVFITCDAAPAEVIRTREADDLPMDE